MDFFEQQELCRRNSRRLLAWFLLAAVATVGSYCVAGAAAWAILSKFTIGVAYVPWQVPATIAAMVGALILCVSALRDWQLREGGRIVAELLGALPVDPQSGNPAERRLLNVVEEMAIAAGVSVPPVYLLSGEAAVNALVAGHSPNEAVIIVTRGAAEKLSRDELQGVVGHEFSHLLNGDMVLNLRLAGLIAGLTFLAEQGERMVHAAARSSRGVAREKQGEAALSALAGALVAFIGFPGALAANAIKAAISRQREFLADAASVQFTRNPEGIAGALDSILALRSHTVVFAARAEALAHMFFAPAVAHWWGFPTHPPIEARIRRAHPRFQREDYRATRHGRRREVAVLDGAGNVVKHMSGGPADIVASVGRPTARHVAFGAQLLAALPSRLHDALHQAAQAERVMFALGGFADRAGEWQYEVQRLAQSPMLVLAELAVPTLKAQPQAARERFLAELFAAVEADRRVTVREFVLATFLRQRLRAGAGAPIETRYPRVEEVAPEVEVVLALLRRAGGAGEGAAPTVLRVSAALEKLRHLAPLAKPAVLKACVAAANADGVMNALERDLVRMVAATLDCPMPPILPLEGQSQEARA